ncbi:RnfH family protein [Marinomonas sp. IMCC 4694]|uniref:RnfH family protein n=1 Tax=Marinomonas sp. IMCC 4694 TaxID=2605432 RepID=UPI0011E816B8|nr:RnfH family protein [Marinomonas sp. IMCC 4694]TYL48885.1 RnfH family protein [Marinomonas sp. IMCC 4694]
MRVEVAYALPEKQKIIVLEVEEHCTVRDAVRQSNISVFFPDVDPETVKVGIFGKAIRNPEEHVLKEGERVELYRELQVDPKQARANRAAKASKA